MTVLTFALKANPLFMLNCSRLTPNLLAGLNLQQIENLSLFKQKNSPKISDIFEVSGTDTENIRFKNSSAQLGYIGHKMTSGSITIEGDAGDFLGANMQGGTLTVKGNAGDRVGDQMRRGLLLIDGNTGDYCGSRMIAGTIGVYGITGKYTGFGMRRGTILLKKQVPLHATIQNCGTHTLPFLSLLFRSFQPLNTLFNQIKSNRVQRYAGDLACRGNGEILMLLD